MIALWSKYTSYVHKLAVFTVVATVIVIAVVVIKSRRPKNNKTRKTNML